jgi:lambda repressor-like predicted transcriptional regulator
MTICSRPTCGENVHALKLCRAHYVKHYRAGHGDYRRVDPSEVVEHIARLRDRGWTWTMLGEASGLAQSVAYQVANGIRKKVSRYAATRLLAIPVVWVESPIIVDIAGTRRRVQALSRMGWPADMIAARADLSETTLRHALGRDRITARIATRIARVYDELSEVRGPSSRAAARAANRGYAPPAAWDDDTIDDPRTKPQGVRRAA